MHCDQAKERLEQVVLDDPTIPLDADLQSHLERCENCRGALHELQEAWLLLPQSLPTPTISEEFEAKVMERVTSAPQPKREYSAYATFWKYAVAASVLFVLTAVSLYALRSAVPRNQEITDTDIDQIRSVAEQVDKLDELERVFASPEVRYVSLKSGTSQPQGYLVYDATGQQAHFFGIGLRPLQGSLHFLWLLDSNGDVLSSTQISILDEKNIGTALVPLPTNLNQLHEAVISVEKSPSPSSPSQDIRLRVPTDG